MKIFIIASFVWTVLLLFIAIVSVVIHRRFVDFYQCKDILNFFSQDFAINTLECDKKYSFVQDRLDGIQCPKERIVSAWEVNLGIPVNDQNEEYGCLQPGCCSKVFQSAKKTLKYISVISFMFFVITLGMAVLGSIIYFEVGDDLVLGISNMTIKTILLATTSVIAVIILTYTSLISPTPAGPPMETHKINLSDYQGIDEKVVVPVNQTEIDYMNGLLADQIYNITNIREDRSKCITNEDGQKVDNCLKTVYEFQLSSKDGIFKPNYPLLEKSNVFVSENAKFGTGWKVVFTGNANNLADFTRYFNFINNCPLYPSKVHIIVKVTGVTENPTAPPARNNYTAPSFIQVSSVSHKMKKMEKDLNKFAEKRDNALKKKRKNNKEAPAVSAAHNPTSFVQIKSVFNKYTPIEVKVPVEKLTLGKQETVFDHKLDHSYVGGRHQKVKGRVLIRQSLDMPKPVSKANVLISPLQFPMCNERQVATDDNGNFEVGPFHVIRKNEPVKFNYKITVPGFKQRTVPVLIGGISSSRVNNLGDIEFIGHKFKDIYHYNMTSTLLDSIKNGPIEKVRISLYTGFLYLENQRSFQGEKLKPIKEHNYTSYGHKLFASVESKHDGTFKIHKIPAGQYTLIYQKDGYYREVRRLTVAGSATYMPKFSKMTEYVKKGQIRFVLDWPNGPSNLDLFAFFRVSKLLKCSVYFGRKKCGGVELSSASPDDHYTDGSVLTINQLGNYYYTFAVNKFKDVSNGLAKTDKPAPGATIPKMINPTYDVPDVPISYSKARILVYSYKFSDAVAQINMPKALADENSEFKWWISFCLDGTPGVRTFVKVNEFTNDTPSFHYCEKYMKELKKNYDYSEI